MFFNKQKPLEVKFVHEKHPDIFKIERAISNRPMWWKNMPPTVPLGEQQSMVSTGATVKACPAIHSFFNYGFVIKTGFDFEFKVDDSWQHPEGFFRDVFPPFSTESEKYFAPGHDVKEMPGIDLSNHALKTLKLDTRIQIIANQDINVLFLPPFWGDIAENSGISLVTGMMQISEKFYGKTGHPIVPNFIVKKGTHALIPKGTPLLQVLIFPALNVSAKEYVLEDDDDVHFFNETRLFNNFHQFSGIGRGKDPLRTPKLRVKEFLFNNAHSIKRASYKEVQKLLKSLRRYK